MTDLATLPGRLGLFLLFVLFGLMVQSTKGGAR